MRKNSNTSTERYPLLKIMYQPINDQKWFSKSRELDLSLVTDINPIRIAQWDY